MTSGPTVSLARDELPRQAGHILALDGLRCFAVMQVMLNHFVVDTRPSDAMPILVASNLLGFLGNGVHLFFVLSGFLITGILLKAKGSGSYFSTFYARRTLRIFPLYYAVLLFVFGGLLIYRLAGNALSADAERAFNTQGYLWFYLTNFSLGLFGASQDFGLLRFGHFWTLAVEEQFYLLWPLLVFMCNRNWLKRICIVACAALLVARFYFHARGDTAITFYLLSNDGLFVGSWLAIATSTRSPSSAMAKRSGLVFLIAGAAFLTLTLGAFAIRANALPASLAGMIRALLPILNTAQCIMFAGLLMLTISVSSDSPLRRVMESRGAVFVGKISYGIYVYHVLLLGAFVWVAHNTVGRIAQPIVAWIATVAVCTALAILVATISWKLFEQPVLRLKDRFSYKPRANADAGESRAGG
jgi:peptidoglycan/LPS O-acetylase OafA/YrhL